MNLFLHRQGMNAQIQQNNQPSYEYPKFPVEYYYNNNNI